ncbi:MAG: translation initiation factor IF-6, partial [Thermoplasmata archaeon]|nr:translation initiation factor IF-6 [Thermoplasmata archaeon]
AGSPYVGVYLKVGERHAIVPPSAPAAFQRELERTFGVSVLRTTIGECEIVGSMVAFNSFGAVVVEDLDDAEAERLETVAPIARVHSRQNAIGNNVLVNDHGAVVHPEFSDAVVAAIGRALHVPSERGTIAGLGTVGMAGLATSKGVVVHPKATESEATHLERVLQVPVHRSTANFGVPIVGACVVANSRALLVGRTTTSVEISHLQEGLQIYD